MLTFKVSAAIALLIILCFTATESKPLSQNRRMSEIDSTLSTKQDAGLLNFLRDMSNLVGCMIPNLSHNVAKSKRKRASLDKIRFMYQVILDCLSKIDYGPFWGALSKLQQKKAKY